MQIDVTLHKGGHAGGWRLALSEPEQHKTSKIFGSSSTQLNATCARWITRYLEVNPVPSGGYLFHKKDDASAPLPPSTWTGLIQRIFLKHGGVKLSPKDCRASYITFLRSNDVNDELVRSTAIAMRHSSSTAASAACTSCARIEHQTCVSDTEHTHTFSSHQRSNPETLDDKNGTQPLVDRAMKATAAFSAKYKA